MYKLKRSEKVVLYGAAAIGKIFKDRLRNCGIEVLGFIDKRAEEINNYLGCSVWKLEELENYIDKDHVIIIAVKNVFEHGKIAEELQKKGFYKIIYRPSSVVLALGSECEWEKEINKIYSLIEEEKLDFNCEIPVTGISSSRRMDFAIIEDNNEWVTANVPSELIFTDNIENGGIWNDISIFNLFPHIKFFASLAGDDDNIEEYIQFCSMSAQKMGNIAITEAWIENVIMNRKNVYYNMALNYELNFKFFIKNAPKVNWNGNYFNLQSGKHRMIFLITKGKSFLPVKIEKGIYKEWINNTDITDEIENIMKDTKLTVPILHPFFYRSANEDQIFYSSAIKHIMFFVGEYTYKKYGFFNAQKVAVYDMTKTNGFFSRCLMRMKYKVTRDVKDELTELIDKLELRQKYLAEKGQERYHVALIDADFYFDLIEKIDAEVNFFLFSEDKKEKLQFLFGDRLNIIQYGIVGCKTKYMAKVLKGE